MNAEQFMQSVERKNADLFKGGSIRITPDSLRAVLRHAFEMGERHGRDSAPKSTDDIFNSLFRR